MTKLCNAIIKFGDDYGDNSSTFHCQLELGHGGPHIERGNMGYEIKDIPYSLEWEGDVEYTCDNCSGTGTLRGSVSAEEERTRCPVCEGFGTVGGVRS